MNEVTMELKIFKCRLFFIKPVEIRFFFFFLIHTSVHNIFQLKFYNVK